MPVWKEFASLLTIVITINTVSTTLILIMTFNTTFTTNTTPSKTSCHHHKPLPLALFYLDFPDLLDVDLTNAWLWSLVDVLCISPRHQGNY